MRAFLAIEIGDELKTVLSGLVDKLSEAGSGIAWVKPAQMHLTLWFFEDLPDALAENVSSAIRDAVRDAEPFQLEIRRTGSFGGSHPRVFWCGFAGDVEKLNNLYTSIEKNFRDIGIRGDGKPFRPHLTIGRNRSGSRQERVSAILRGMNDYSVGKFPVEGLTLFRSELRPGGPVHTPMGHFLLGGAS